MSPHQYLVTQLNHMEKPQTGQYIHWTETGSYKCINCDSLLFKSEYKLVDDSGYASFWTSDCRNVTLSDPSQAVIDHRNKNPLYKNMKELVKNSLNCTCCGSFLGILINDSTPPHFHKYCINSASIHFEEKEYFEDPRLLKKQREIKKEAMR